MEVSGIKPENLPYTEFGELIFKYLVNTSVIIYKPIVTITNQIIELEEASVKVGGMVCSSPSCKLRPTAKLPDHSRQKITTPTSSNINN